MTSSVPAARDSEISALRTVMTGTNQLAHKVAAVINKAISLDVTK